MKLENLELQLEKIERSIEKINDTNYKKEKRFNEDYECYDCGYTNHVELRVTYDEPRLSTEEMLSEVDNITRIIRNIKIDIDYLKHKSKVRE